MPSDVLACLSVCMLDVVLDSACCHAGRGSRLIVLFLRHQSNSTFH